MTLEEMKRLKAEKGYTLAQLSEYSQVPLGTLQKIFTGETANPRYATRQAIEKALCGPEPSSPPQAEDSHVPVTYPLGQSDEESLPNCVQEIGRAHV